MNHSLIEREFETLFAASDQISLFAWENTTGWPIVYSTANAQTMLGYSESDFSERRICFLDKVYEADRNRVSEEINAALADPKVKSFTHQDYRMVRADGDIVWVSDTTVVIRDHNDQVLYLLGYVLDISSRKRLELRLQSERRYLNQVIDGARLASWSWDREHKQVRVNEHWLALVGDSEAQELISEAQWDRWVHPNDRAIRMRALVHHIEQKTEFYEAVYRIQDANNRSLYVLDRGQAVSCNEKGEVTRLSGILTDITLHKEAELAAQRNAEVRNRILASVSHEVRTPLHGIIGLASVLAREVKNPEHQRMLQTILQSGDDLIRAMSDVLDMTRNEHEQAPINLNVYEIAGIAQHVRDLFTERANQKALLFVCDILPGTPERAMFDRARVLQVLINLVDNAIKYTEQGYVRVYLGWSAPSVDSELVIRVEDSGRGIRDIERVWEMFVQEPDESASRQTGSGVGLSIVKSLIEAMQGRIEVESGVAQGSVFTVFLPSVAAMPTHKISTQTDNNDKIDFMRNRIALVVDDSDVNQLVLGQMLERLGLNFVSVSSGEEALSFLSKHHADIVFMDLRMSGLSGFETTEAIHAALDPPPVIIGLTAQAVAEIEEQAQQAGMTRCLSKPFLFSDIRDVITEHLG
ncbi:PAS domain-containing protein [Aliidiomarina celeris]|uniref:PAS domain-containing protein n=1 Tax=Aliidiomarina celeris TaxID=2249428 RepID=UPI000DEA4864|nr:PAS domain-containing protein [Aliidiomarina celeris]